MRRETREVAKTRRRYIPRIGRKILRHRGVFYANVYFTKYERNERGKYDRRGR